jgi:hypothetical protein
MTQDVTPIMGTPAEIIALLHRATDPYFTGPAEDYASYNNLLADEDRYNNCRNCGMRLSSGENGHINPRADMICQTPESRPTFKG